MSKIKVSATAGIYSHFNIRLQDQLQNANNIVINVYTLHIIARHAVNKQHSLGMRTENIEPKNLWYTNRRTGPSLHRQQSIALLLTYFTGFNIYIDVYTVTCLMFLNWHEYWTPKDWELYPYKNELAICHFSVIYFNGRKMTTLWTKQLAVLSSEKNLINSCANVALLMSCNTSLMKQ
jgi:hypothetical protein